MKRVMLFVIALALMSSRAWAQGGTIGGSTGGGGATVTDTVRAVTFDSVRATRVRTDTIRSAVGSNLYLRAMGASRILLLRSSDDAGNDRAVLSAGTAGTSKQFLNLFGDTINLFSGVSANPPDLIRNGAGNFTLQCGTGNSRTCTFRTTTSAGTAKNTLVLGADSSATFLGRVLSSGGFANSAPAFSFADDPNTGLNAFGADHLCLTTGGNLRFCATNTGQLQAQQFGSATAPVYSFSASTNTGMYGLSAGSEDTLAFAVNGSNVLKIKDMAATGAGDVALCRTTGNVVTQGATCGSSTAKIKTGITWLRPRTATQTLMSLRPSSYRYRPGFYGERAEYGLIAEEVAKVDPRLAFYADADDSRLGIKAGDPINVNDRAVMSLMLATMQDQQRTIDSLRAGHTPVDASTTPTTWMLVLTIGGALGIAAYRKYGQRVA